MSARRCVCVAQTDFAKEFNLLYKSEGQAVLGRQSAYATPWLTERHGYDPISSHFFFFSLFPCWPAGRHGGLLMSARRCVCVAQTDFAKEFNLLYWVTIYSVRQPSPVRVPRVSSRFRFRAPCYSVRGHPPRSQPPQPDRVQGATDPSCRPQPADWLSQVVPEQVLAQTSAWSQASVPCSGQPSHAS